MRKECTTVKKKKSNGSSVGNLKPGQGNFKKAGNTEKEFLSQVETKEVEGKNEWVGLPQKKGRFKNRA